MTPSIGLRIIPDYISRFTERFPRALLFIVEGYSQSLAEQVAMGKLDFALLSSLAESCDRSGRS